MYYREQLIDGKLHYKTHPDGKWIEFTSQMLNERIKDLELRLNELVIKEIENE